MVIRPRSQHKKCTECIKHKLILKKLARHEHGKKAQMALFSHHLSRQYSDRTEYWKARTRSRQGTDSSGQRELVIILDSVDHGKFHYPRDEGLGAKDFSNWIRPCLTCTGVIVHGVATFLFLSEDFVVKDSSWACELLAHVLHVVDEGGIDLRDCTIWVQSDNASKECKNNTMMRILAGLVVTRRCRAARLCCLQSGHSHEDIDQWFSGLSSYITACDNLSTPADFVESLQVWMNGAGSRKDEAIKKCILVDQTRAWQLGMCI